MSMTDIPKWMYLPPSFLRRRVGTNKRHYAECCPGIVPINKKKSPNNVTQHKLKEIKPEKGTIQQNINKWEIIP
jgi:hypothetical protein